MQTVSGPFGPEPAPRNGCYYTTPELRQLDSFRMRRAKDEVKKFLASHGSSVRLTASELRQVADEMQITRGEDIYIIRNTNRWAMDGDLGTAEDYFGPDTVATELARRFRYEVSRLAADEVRGFTRESKTVLRFERMLKMASKLLKQLRKGIDTDEGYQAWTSSRVVLQNIEDEALRWLRYFPQSESAALDALLCDSSEFSALDALLDSPLNFNA